MSYHYPKVISHVVAAAFLAAGCSGGSLDGIATGSTSQSAAQFIRAERNGRVFAAAPDPSTSSWSQTATGYGLIREPAAEAYLQSIVTRLLEHWHGEKPERVGVFIQTGDSVHAIATPSGDILIPIGGFDELESEDDLAALIGHELGHIVLKHREVEKQANQIAKVASTAVSLVFATSTVRNSGMHRYGNTREFYLKDPNAVQRDTLRAIAVQQSLVTITQDIVLTAFGREHEYQADIFGMRLAGYSGWNHRAMLNLTQRWHDAEETERKRKEAALKNAGLLQGFTQAIGQVAADAIASHPSAESRRENLVKDMQVSFKDAEAKPPITAPYLKTIGKGEFAKKRELWRHLRKVLRAMIEGRSDEVQALAAAARRMPGGDHPDSRLIIWQAVSPASSQEAISILSTADMRQPATREFYKTLIETYLGARQYPDARRIADIGKRFYHEQMLPLQMAIVRDEVAAASGNGQRPAPKALVEEMTALKKICEATRDEALIEGCRWGETGRYSDQDYNNCGGFITALATMAPGGNNRCKTPTDVKASAPATTPAAQNSNNPWQSVLSGIYGSKPN